MVDGIQGNVGNTILLCIAKKKTFQQMAQFNGTTMVAVVHWNSNRIIKIDQKRYGLLVEKYSFNVIKVNW